MCVHRQSAHCLIGTLVHYYYYVTFTVYSELCFDREAGYPL